MSSSIIVDRRTGQKILTGGAAAGAVALSLANPANAQSAPAQEVQNMVTSLGGIATAALAVAIVPMAISFAFKIVRRVMR